MILVIYGNIIQYQSLERMMALPQSLGCPMPEAGALGPIPIVGVVHELRSIEVVLLESVRAGLNSVWKNAYQQIHMI